MICYDLAKTRKTIADELVLNITYTPPQAHVEHVGELSPVAQKVFYEFRSQPSRLSTDNTLITALQLLDFFSSKQGFIRRKGQTFRTTTFYRQSVPQFVRAIQQQKPLRMSTLCFCTTLANTKYGGESPYPHMASYIALENMHKIAKGAADIYAPGVQFYLGFEGYLFQPLYFQTNTVLKHTLAILKDLNTEAALKVGNSDSTIQIIDALWMIDQAFGSFAHFNNLVEDRKQHVQSKDIAEWQLWYKKTVSGFYFPSIKSRDNFIDERARWREAVHYYKRNGGIFSGGMLCFADDVIPFTPSGRRPDVLALQLVPENSYLPHQRIITHDAKTDRWRMKAYEEIKTEPTKYAPRYVQNYLYPFYFEKI